MIVGFEKLNALPAPHFLDREEWSWTKGNKGTYHYDMATKNSLFAVQERQNFTSGENKFMYPHFG